MKNVIIIFLVIALLGFGGWTFYTLKYTVPAKAEIECKKACTAKTTQIISDKIGEVTTKAEEVVTKAEECSVILEQLKSVPACATALQTALNTSDGTTKATTTAN